MAQAAVKRVSRIGALAAAADAVIGLLST